MSIQFKGVDYPTRTFTVISDEFDGSNTYTIATESLFNALDDKYEMDGTEEKNIDEQIYFYVEDEVINLTAHEICSNHLDITMTCVEEIL
jgi:hypothetical protein